MTDWLYRWQVFFPSSEPFYSLIDEGVAEIGWVIVPSELPAFTGTFPVAFAHWHAEGGRECG